MDEETAQATGKRIFELCTEQNKPKLEALFKELIESDGRSGKGASIFSMITRGAVPPIVVIGGLLIIGDFPLWLGLFSIIAACFIGVAWIISLDE